jgi:hypothetical protein
MNRAPGNHECNAMPLPGGKEETTDYTDYADFSLLKKNSHLYSRV